MPARFEAMYRGEFKAVWRFVARLGVPAASVEDVVHDVFLTAFRRLETYDAARPARAWLFGIAFRLASDFRALKRHVHEVGPGAEGGEEPFVDPVAVPERLDAQRILDIALGRMSLEARAVFVMHELEERSVPEIAEATGTLVPTAYTRLRSARQTFAEVVSESNGGAA